MMIATDDAIIPEVQPKGFTTAISPRNNNNTVQFSNSTKSPKNTKSKSLGLSLRRITPDTKSSKSSTLSPRNNYNDGASTTTGTTSRFSRLTGRSSKSGYSTATPQHANTTSRSPARRSRSIEKQQKMEDEYYTPSMHWADDDMDGDDGLDDGELPSLSNKGGSRWRAIQQRRQLHYGDDDEEESRDVGYEQQLSYGPTANVVSPNNNASSPEQLKVAGFWSQLDDTDIGSSDDESIITEKEEEEEMPGDERQFVRSISPPRSRILNNNSNNNSNKSSNRRKLIGAGLLGAAAAGASRRVGFTSNASKNKNKNNEDTNMNNVEIDNEANNDGASIGLDLVEPNSDDDDTAGIPPRQVRSTTPTNTTVDNTLDNSKDTTKDTEGNNWNLLEKAACFNANENGTTHEASTTQYEEEDDDDQSLDQTFFSGGTGRNKKSSGGGGGETRGTSGSQTGNQGGDDGEEDGIMACISVALATMCGYEAFDATTANNDESTSPTKQRAHDIINKKKRRKKKNGTGYESDDNDSIFTDYDMEDEEDTAIELQFHADQALAGGANSPPNSPRKKKNPLKKLLKLGKKKRIKNPRKTLVTTTTRTGKEPVVNDGEEVNKTRMTDMYESKTFEEEILGQDPEDEDPQDGMTGTAAGVAAAAAISSNRNNAYDDDNDDEAELQSEAAAWSANKKNTYLRQLAERAKADYATGHESPVPQDNNTNGMAIAAGVAVGVGAAVAASSRYNNRQDDDDEGTIEEGDESTLGSISRQDTGSPQQNQTDYNSLTPAEKRQFLRLLNSGMSPHDAALQIAQERDAASPTAIVEEDEGQDTEYVTDRRGEGPVTRSSRQPFDESIPRSLSADPPGGQLAIGSGESGELSAKEENEDPVEASRSEMAQDSSKSGSGGKKYAALAAIPLVPAIVRAKQRSRSKSRDRKKQDDQQDEDVAMQEVEDTPVEEETDDDGLLSSGIGYYDARGRGIDPSGSDDYDPYDNGYGDNSSEAPTRGRSRKSKLLGNLPKVRVGQGSGGDSYANVANAAALSPRSVNEDDTTKKPLSKLNFMNRNANKKQWGKLDSDVALDQVAPSRSAEVGAMPSWLVSRDEDDKEEEYPVNADLMDEDEEDDMLDSMEEEDDDEVVEESPEDESENMWSPSMSTEIDEQERERRIVASPTSYASTPGTNHSEDDTDVVLSPDSLALSPGSNTGDDEEEEEDHREVRTSLSPTDATLPGLIPNEEIDNMSMSYASTTTGSTWTAASKSHRRRHKGAASKRLQEANEAGAKNKGWLNSIRDAASTQGQVWDPEHGWVDYTEPEKGEGQDYNYSTIGNLQVPPSKRKLPPASESVDIRKKRDIAANTVVGSRDAVMATQQAAVTASSPNTDQDSIFDDESMTVNTLNTNGDSVYSNSTAPTRRSKPRHRPTDKRKTGKANDQKKPIGWKESMENATAKVDDGSGRYWDYERGWVSADGTVDDDTVSVLTKNTLEQNSPVIPESPHQHLQSVAEEDSNSEEESAVHLTTRNAVATKSASQEEKNDIELPSLINNNSDNSDKENGESVKDGEDTSKASTLSAPLQQHSEQDNSNGKRSLNQWLEKANNTPSQSSNNPAESDSDFVLASRDASKAATDASGVSSTIPIVSPDNSTKKEGQSPFGFSNMMDPFGELDEDGFKDVKVVKEKCSDVDSELFETPKFNESVNRLLKSAQEQPPKSADDAVNKSVSTRAKMWMSSVEKRTQQRVVGEGDSSSAMEVDSNAPQVNNATGVQEDPPQNLDPPSTYTAGTKNAKKADSWIRSQKNDNSSENSGGDVNNKTSSVGNLRSKYENKAQANVKALEPPPSVASETKPVFVKTNSSASQNDVYFRSSAMGIRLKRGEDGFVRVVSVTEATTGSSIVRDGDIEPEDRVLEAAGVDLREPITNSQWGETVTKIRSAPRPMKFVVSAGPKRKSMKATAEQPSSLPPPPAKYVMESRLSKTPQGQQVLQTLSTARTSDRDTSADRVAYGADDSSQTVDNTVASRSMDDDEETSDPRKESIFKRIASGCAAPTQACTTPSNQKPNSSLDNKDEDGKVPMAHLQFLRTNPSIARVKDAASRVTGRPDLFKCGRPDTIFEEPDATDNKPKKRSSSKANDRSMQSYNTSMSRSRSLESASYENDSHTMGSSVSGGGTGNTAYLEQLALNSAVANNKSTRSRRDNANSSNNNMAKKTKVQYGSPLQQGNDTTDWPVEDNNEKEIMNKEEDDQYEI